MLLVALAGAAAWHHLQSVSPAELQEGIVTQGHAVIAAIRLAVRLAALPLLVFALGAAAGAGLYAARRRAGRSRRSGRHLVKRVSVQESQAE